jgi:hypothetical protein
MHDIERSHLEATQEMEEFEFEQYDLPGEVGEVLPEAEELDLAAELLEVRDEQELDQFLGKLIRRAGGALGRIVRSPIGQALGGTLKGLAKRAFPQAAGVIDAVGSGRLGPAIGGQIAAMAGPLLGFEAEATDQEDREFEGAKQFVRLAASAVQRATEPAAGADARMAAQGAVRQAAQALAPGLVQAPAVAAAPAATGLYGGRGRSGRWLRRGNKIVLFGV